LAFEFICADNDRRLRASERDAPSGSLVMILEVSTEPHEIIANRIECGDGMSGGIRVRRVDVSNGERPGQCQPCCKVDGKNWSHTIDAPNC
jgi:hypothetical protein